MSHSLLEPSAASIAPHLVPREHLADGTVRFHLDARPTTVEVQGLPAQVLGYNGTLPGPLLVLQEGERVRVVFRNNLSEPTSLRFHGLPLTSGDEAPPRDVAPGEVVTHAFDVPAGAAGTYWYHPPLSGGGMRQLFEGLAGPLVVRGPLDREEPLASAQELVLLLQDITFEGGRPAPFMEEEAPRGKEGRLVLVNGEVLPSPRVQTGLVRLRITSASTARSYHLHIPGHPLHLLGMGSGLLGAPGTRASLLLAPGGCADVLVEVRQAGQLQLLHSPQPSPLAPLPLLTLNVEGEPVASRLPAMLRSAEGPDGRRAADASAP